MKPRQVPIFLYWHVENVQFWINSIGHLGWLSCILNFPRFHKNVNSLELWKYISENSSPKGSSWRNKRKSEFSSLSADSRYLLAVALKTGPFKRKFEIKPIPILLNILLNANNHFWYCWPFFGLDLMRNSTGYVIKQLVHAFSCTLSSYGALGKFGEHSWS